MDVSGWPGEDRSFLDRPEKRGHLFLDERTLDEVYCERLHPFLETA